MPEHAGIEPDRRAGVVALFSFLANEGGEEGTLPAQSN
jgi:hypothetical protein